MSLDKRVYYAHVQSYLTLCDPWTVARQTPLSMGFLRQEYWSGLPCPTPGDLPNPQIEPKSPASPPLAGRFFTTEPLGEQKSHFLTQIANRKRKFPVIWTIDGNFKPIFILSN